MAPKKGKAARQWVKAKRPDPQQGQEKKNGMNNEEQKQADQERRDESTEEPALIMPPMKKPGQSTSTCQAQQGGAVTTKSHAKAETRHQTVLVLNSLGIPTEAIDAISDSQRREFLKNSKISDASLLNLFQGFEAFDEPACSLFKQIRISATIEQHHKWLAKAEELSSSVEGTPKCDMNPADDNNDLKSDADTSNTMTAVPEGLHFTQYDTNLHERVYLPAIRQLISKDLSEPYSIYVYRYFLYQWGDLCFMALDQNEALVGVIVCKLEPHRSGPLRGYIAMLAVREEHRGHGIATRLVRLAIDKMVERDADEIALETEVTNVPSLKLYERLGFLRCKQLHRYYLNGNAAFRLVLQLKAGLEVKDTRPEPASQAPVVPPKATVMADQPLNGATASS